jgi:hypothetical protein
MIAVVDVVLQQSLISLWRFPVLDSACTKGCDEYQI